MRVLVAMSGGVDSSVAAALLVDRGDEVVGATMKLWGGDSDSGCCSVSDVEDARRVAQQLGIAHHVFNFTADFDARVVGPYVAAHAAGRTPNPCVECNRHLKFDRFLDRARQLGFDAIATGHHAQVVAVGDRWSLRRGADRAKDQSYVLHMLDQRALAHTLLPVGAMTKAAVRADAARRGLRTAAKPDSQDVCFITASRGRATFLRDRIDLHPGSLLDDRTGTWLGEVAAVELVTIGQRRGMGVAAGERRYATAVDVGRREVRVGTRSDLECTEIVVDQMGWVDDRPVDAEALLAQTSAHGEPVPATWHDPVIRLSVPHRRVAPGQSVVLYRDDAVVGGGFAA
ncbi:MAG TPA: tRNA 2-thiouridine(34) synthase MnmA [Acidimicrobiales bacterium]|nr:tRNA 2-thiouridine(34) synthase MnmA [Acidimicrobiales bacterium]